MSTNIGLNTSNFKVEIDNINTILAKRGLEERGRTQRLFTDECARYMDKYIPMRSATMKNLKLIIDNSITYLSPYSRFQHGGKVMIGVKSHSPWAKSGEKKKLTNRNLKYNGAPKRGAYFEERMWEEDGEKIVKTIERSIGV